MVNEPIKYVEYQRLHKEGKLTTNITNQAKEFGLLLTKEDANKIEKDMKMTIKEVLKEYFDEILEEFD